jgi:hypothetical protein
MTQQLPQRFPLRPVPKQLSALRSAVGTKGQLQLVLAQITHHAADTAQDGELLQDQADQVLHLFVGIELQFAVRTDDIAGRRLAQPLAAPTAIQTAGLHALLQLVQLDAPHEAFDGQEQAIIEIMRMVQAILVGQQGVKTAADLDQATTGLIFTGQAIDLKAEDQADMPQGDFRQKHGEIVSADGAGAGAALIAIEYADALAGPAPGQRTLLEMGLDLSRFAVTLHLLRMRLAHINDGPPFEVMSLDFCGSAYGEGVNGTHPTPPFRRRRLAFGGAAEPSAPAEQPTIAERRRSGVASRVLSAARSLPSLVGAGGC